MDESFRSLGVGGPYRIRKFFLIMIRERLTITLREDILKTVDRAIDGTKIRNRSHAIEYLIQKASSPAITHALILAGGKGAKPGPLSKEMPKAMLPVGGKPALEHTLLLCKQHGLHNIIISMGPEGAEIEKYFGDGSRFDLSITYLKQARSEVGTAPAMKQAEALLKNEPFVLMYGDVVADINVTDLIEFHLGMNTLGTMALTSVDRAHDWGVVLLHGTKITAFIENQPPMRTHTSLTPDCFVFSRRYLASFLVLIPN